MEDREARDRAYRHFNSILEEESDDLFRNSNLAFARAAQNPLLDIFEEICNLFNFGSPIFKQLQPLRNSQSKRMSLTINKLGISVVGIGKTIDKAKRSAAVKMLMEIRKSARNGESLNEVKTPELVNCGEWMKKYPSVKAIILHEETPTEDPRQEHSRWILANWLKERRRVMNFYMCVAFEDSPGSPSTFSISCHHTCYITIGEGQTIADGKNYAASKMLEILRDGRVEIPNEFVF